MQKLLFHCGCDDCCNIIGKPIFTDDLISHWQQERDRVCYRAKLGNVERLVTSY